MPAALPLSSARDRIVDAAIELFATRGYQAIGLRDLAGHLGLHAGSLYHHIENKQSLLFEIIESALADLIADTQRQVKRARTSGEGVRGFVNAFVGFAATDRHRLALLTRDAVHLSPEHRQQIRALEHVYLTLLRGLVAKLRPTPAVDVLARAILGMFYGHAQWQDPDMNGEAQRQALFRLVLAMINTPT